MGYREIINRLIAADDLHYDPRQRRFVSLSDEQVDAITKQCDASGITDQEQVNKVVAWAGSVRVGELVCRAFLAGRLRVTGFSGAEPRFIPVEPSPSNDSPQE